jgi:hypothetical protein
MMRHRSQAALMLFGLMLGCRDAREESEAAAAPPPSLVDQAGETAVALDSAAISRIGLQTMKLAAVSRAPEVELPALVIEDPGATITVRAGVGGRLREADGHRWPGIGEQLQGGDPIAQVGDAIPVVIPRSGTVSRLLAQPGELVQPGQELLELVDYGAPLIRVAWSDEAAAPPASLQLVPLGGGSAVRAALVGPAPTSDPVTLGPATLYRATGTALRPGQALLARVPSGRGLRRGVMVPAAAVVQWDGLTWAFVARAPGRFVRVLVPTDVPLEGGWLAEQGFSPGEEVVTVAAGQLLAEEFRARITVGEEVGE